MLKILDQIAPERDLCDIILEDCDNSIWEVTVILKAFLSVINLLAKSIVSNDIIILGAAVFALCLFMLTIVLSNGLDRNCKKAKKKNQRIHKGWYTRANRSYDIFITMISIFPLLGMLGTVFGLLGLDLATGDMENIKANFFVALTSTAWGIIFSVIFKVLHAFISSGVEEKLEEAKKLLEEDE